MLKSKYYPNGKILDTVLASDASPAWRGVEFGLQLLKRGLIWRVGNGNRIQFQRDQWLERKEWLMTANLIRRSRIRWVNQLILSDSKEWNVPLINQIFHHFDAEEIQKIRLPRKEMEDCVAWHYEHNEIFSVRGAYKLAAAECSWENSAASSSSADANDRRIWDYIWKANVPEKIKIHGWRVASNTVATKRNCLKRTLTTDSTCDICGNGEENEYHANISRTKSEALRNAFRKMWTLPDEKAFWYTWEDWLQNLLSTCNDITKSRVLLILWHMRNNCIRGDGKESASNSVQFLIRYGEEIRSCQTEAESEKGKCPWSLTESIPSRPPNSSPSHWIAAETGVVNINTNASFLISDGHSGVGAVARDHNGLVFVAVCQRIGIYRSVRTG